MGMTVLVGGFGLCAIPEHAIEAIRTKGLTVINKPDLIDLGFRSYQNIRFELEHKKHVDHIISKDIKTEYNRVMYSENIFE
ncbi:MAG: hypothetical protein L0L98_02500 [Staphylococcus equorum]|nr:hypothetical protein [Staphylococcus equorum]